MNNAGAARGDDRVPVTDLDPALWRKVIDVNLTGSFLDVGGDGPADGRRRATAGRSSTSPRSPASGSARTPRPTPRRRPASRRSPRAWPRRSPRHGVRVNAICPGIIDTSRMDDIGRGEVWDQIVDGDDPARARRHRRRHRRHRDVPVLRPGRVGHRPVPGTSTAAPSCSTEPRPSVRASPPTRRRRAVGPSGHPSRRCRPESVVCAESGGVRPSRWCAPESVVCARVGGVQFGTCGTREHV